MASWFSVIFNSLSTGFVFWCLNSFALLRLLSALFRPSTTLFHLLYRVITSFIYVNTRFNSVGTPFVGVRVPLNRVRKALIRVISPFKGVISPFNRVVLPLLMALIRLLHALYLIADMILMRLILQLFTIVSLNETSWNSPLAWDGSAHIYNHRARNYKQ